VGRPPLRGSRAPCLGWGYDGLEIAVSGDHLDAWRWDEPGYVDSKLAVLEKYNLKVWAISNHLKGQAVCDDPIDFRHEAIVGSRVWGDGEPEGVRQRAAEEMKHTARLAKALGVDTVVGFTGSSIWQYVAMFPPVPEKVIDAGYQDFADRWNPILDVFDENGVASPTKSTRARSLTTTGPPSGRWKRSGTAKRSD
jgi:sugar phosphate isomerase/epimerase